MADTYKFLDYEGLKLFKELLDENGYKDTGSSGNSTGVPVGTIINYAGTAVPDNFLICDGSLLDRAMYSQLFNAIGTVYGEGDGESTFALPDAEGLFAQWSATPGTVFSAGAPEIYGETASINYADMTANYASGVFSVSQLQLTPKHSSSTGDNYWDALYMYASAYNSIYGNSNTIQPPAITVVPAIRYI